MKYQRLETIVSTLQPVEVKEMREYEDSRGGVDRRVARSFFMPIGSPLHRALTAMDRRKYTGDRRKNA